jgi:hypothetical protein
MMKKTALIIVLVLLVMAISLVVWYPQRATEDTKPVTTIETKPCESLLTGCVRQIDGFSILLKFPGNVVYLKPFPVEVNISGDNVSQLKSVNIKFTMTRMDMGLNEYRLQRDAQNSMLWKGNAVLPVCVTGRSDWLAHIEAELNDRRYQLIVPFEVSSSAQ